MAKAPSFKWELKKENLYYRKLSITKINPTPYR